MLVKFLNKEFYSEFSSRALGKVSDWNSFRVNQNYSHSFRYLYPSQCVSLRTSPKNVLYLIWWKTDKNQSDLIRLIPWHQSEWIRTNSKPNSQSRPTRARFDPNRIFNQNQSGLETWFRMASDSFRLMSSNLIDNSVQLKTSFWT